MSQLDQLGNYLVARQRDRDEVVALTWSAMTEREQRLVREAAVMGYVQGVMCGPHRDKIPHDKDILSQVIDACLHNSDLYPVIAGLAA